MKNTIVGILAVFSYLGLVSISYGQSGACGGIAGQTCSDSQYCDYANTGTCGEADQQGVCLPIPAFCTKQYMPVCGCDGVVYSNACMANAAGVSVAPDEVCLNKTPVNVEVLQCVDGGSAQVIVCGVKDGDNKEYPNPCAALEDGATNVVPKTGDSCPAFQ